MIAYTITSAGKVKMYDESTGDIIPKWAYEKDGYFIVEELPADVKVIYENQIAEDNLRAFRNKRDTQLKATDFLMVLDVNASLSETQKTEITDYRQALRDSTEAMTLPDPPGWL